MAINATLKKATSCKLTYLLVGDGATLSKTITNATLQADCVSGPLANALNNTYANIATMKQTFGEGSVRMWLRPESQQWPAGVSVAIDGVSPTKPAVIVSATVAPASTSTAYLDVEFVHSVVR